ncbi:MAG: hypothetical protein IJC88_04710 [Oscillospiraceae bacterium]|nr:hypothetical protein [Oscillospiraceae bacterium]
MKRLILLTICILMCVVGCEKTGMTYETSFQSFFADAREMLWENIISKDSIAYEDLFFEDEMVKPLFIDETEVLAYFTHIRVETDDVTTYTYGYYAVDVSLETIYEYDIATEIWHKVE